MTAPTSVPEPADVTLTVTAAVRHLCPFKEEVDDGALTVTWRTAGSTLELHSLRSYLDGFSTTEISHETLTDRVRDELSALPGITRVTVSSAWKTAGMEVSCSTSPTPVRPSP